MTSHSSERGGGGSFNSQLDGDVYHNSSTYRMQSVFCMWVLDIIGNIGGILLGCNLDPFFLGQSLPGDSAWGCMIGTPRKCTSCMGLCRLCRLLYTGWNIAEWHLVWLEYTCRIWDQRLRVRVYTIKQIATKGRTQPSYIAITHSVLPFFQVFPYCACALGISRRYILRAVCCCHHLPHAVKKEE